MCTYAISELFSMLLNPVSDSAMHRWLTFDLCCLFRVQGVLLLIYHHPVYHRYVRTTSKPTQLPDNRFPELNSNMEPYGYSDMLNYWHLFHGSPQRCGTLRSLPYNSTSGGELYFIIPYIPYIYRYIIWFRLKRV